MIGDRWVMEAWEERPAQAAWPELLDYAFRPLPGEELAPSLDELPDVDYDVFDVEEEQLVH